MTFMAKGFIEKFMIDCAIAVSVIADQMAEPMINQLVLNGFV
jgi:nicotinamide mononucleotide (NMN) deamidase PncC